MTGLSVETNYQSKAWRLMETVIIGLHGVVISPTKMLLRHVMTFWGTEPVLSNLPGHLFSVFK